MTAREIIREISRLEGYGNDEKAERIIQQAIDAERERVLAIKQVRLHDEDVLEFEFDELWTFKCCDCGLLHTFAVRLNEDEKTYSFQIWQGDKIAEASMRGCYEQS